MDGLPVYRRNFLQSGQGYGARVLSEDRAQMPRDALGTTCIFSSIGDALSKVYSSTKETVSEVADKVVDTVSDAYEATSRTASSAADLLSDAYDTTRESVGNVAELVADVVSETASNAYETTVETLSQAAETVGEAVSDAYDSTRETVTKGFDATCDYVDDVASGEKELNYWRVLGGAAIGVGAVAAAPFTGGGSLLGAASLAGSLAGAGTIAAAVGIGVAGAVVGANLDGDTQLRKESYEEGRKDAKAEHVAEVSALQKNLAGALESLKAAGKHFNAIIALHAVAVATAHCDGGIGDDEREGIELFIAGLASGTTPPAVLERIESLYREPPTVSEAYALARDSEVDMVIFDEIINLVIHADSTIYPQEAAFMQAWSELKSA